MNHPHMGSRCGDFGREDRLFQLSQLVDGRFGRSCKLIKNDTYGYCEETGEPIGLKRLIARPIATLSIEAQEKHEKNEKIYADL